MCYLTRQRNVQSTTWLVSETSSYSPIHKVQPYSYLRLQLNSQSTKTLEYIEVNKLPDRRTWMKSSAEWKVGNPWGPTDPRHIEVLIPIQRGRGKGKFVFGNRVTDKWNSLPQCCKTLIKLRLSLRPFRTLSSVIVVCNLLMNFAT